MNSLRKWWLRRRYLKLTKRHAEIMEQSSAGRSLTAYMNTELREVEAKLLVLVDEIRQAMKQETS